MMSPSDSSNGRPIDRSFPKSEECVVENPSLLHAAVECSPDAILFIDRATLRFLDANPAACQGLGYSLNELRQRALEEVVSQPRVDELVTAFDAAIAGRPGAEVIRVCHRSKSGVGVPVQWRLRAVPTSQGIVMVVVACPLAGRRLADSHGISPREALVDCSLACNGNAPREESQCWMQGYDPLTGLPDRRRFEQRLSLALAVAAQRPERAFAVLFVDLDGFKAVNDTMGHLPGDRLLCEIVHRLSDSVRVGDMIARFGGDEFLVLVDHLQSEDDAIHVAERIRTELESPVDINGHTVTVSASIGIALSWYGYTTPEAMIHDADQAMYRAKAIGKAQYAIFAGGASS